MPSAPMMPAKASVSVTVRSPCGSGRRAVRAMRESISRSNQTVDGEGSACNSQMRWWPPPRSSSAAVRGWLRTCRSPRKTPPAVSHAAWSAHRTATGFWDSEGRRMCCMFRDGRSGCAVRAAARYWRKAQPVVYQYQAGDQRGGPGVMQHRGKKRPAKHHIGNTGTDLQASRIVTCAPRVSDRYATR